MGGEEAAVGRETGGGAGGEVRVGGWVGGWVNEEEERRRRITSRLDP